MLIVGRWSFMYTRAATATTPALIIYLIDASDSMNELCGDTTKIALVNKALYEVMKDMVRRSIRDGIPQSRYKLALFAYSSRVIDVLNGICDLPTLLRQGIPEISAGGMTDTAAAFAAAERLLLTYINDFRRGPAPLVCHLTDGRLSTVDPTPYVRRIQGMNVDDGTVLVENVYVGESCGKTIWSMNMLASSIVFHRHCQRATDRISTVMATLCSRERPCSFQAPIAT